MSRIYGFISDTPEFCPWYLSAGSVYFGSLELDLRVLVQRILLLSVRWIFCDDGDISSGSVYFGTPQVGFMVT
jgi:hypothetical protein